ncbi:hypothetical protein GGI10_005424, partial [Coemansia sp. RSA 2530]
TPTTLWGGVGDDNDTEMGVGHGNYGSQAAIHSHATAAAGTSTATNRTRDVDCGRVSNGHASEAGDSADTENTRSVYLAVVPQTGERQDTTTPGLPGPERSYPSRALSHGGHSDAPLDNRASGLYGQDRPTLSIPRGSDTPELPPLPGIPPPRPNLRVPSHAVWSVSSPAHILQTCADSDNATTGGGHATHVLPGRHMPATPGCHDTSTTGGEALPPHDGAWVPNPPGEVRPCPETLSRVPRIYLRHDSNEDTSASAQDREDTAR